MGFKSVASLNLAKFNSSTSSDFLSQYESYKLHQIQSDLMHKPKSAIAPSALRCSRRTWFRLRGTDPDIVKSPDLALDFTATVGTACHRSLQADISTMLGDSWISVDQYLQEFPIKYDYVLIQDTESLETKVSIKDPPINFAVDGIIELNGQYYLLEIKTCDYSSFKDLANPKPEHLDQIQCYSALLGIYNVIFLYQDRLYGDLKCYEVFVSSSAVQNIRYKIDNILKCVDMNIAPDRLPYGDKWCSNCPYSIKCKQWG